MQKRSHICRVACILLPRKSLLPPSVGRPVCVAARCLLMEMYHVINGLQSCMHRESAAHADGQERKSKRAVLYCNGNAKNV